MSYAPKRACPVCRSLRCPICASARTEQPGRTRQRRLGRVYDWHCLACECDFTDEFGVWWSDEFPGRAMFPDAVQH